MPQTLSGTPKQADYARRALSLYTERAVPRPTVLDENEECVNRPGFAGGSGYWIATSGWSVRCAS